MENQQNGKYNVNRQESETNQKPVNPNVWRELSKVHRLDDSRDIPGTLFKYMKEHSLEKSFNGGDGNQSLLFVEPSKWKDPFERLIYNAIFKGGSASRTPKTYVCCMTTQMSSEAAWLVYGQNELGTIERCAKLVINTETLFREIDRDARQKGYSVYIGMVDYEPSQKLRNLTTSSPIFKNCLENKKFTLTSFLKLLCLKRKMYSYEKEIRFLLVNDTETQVPTKDFQATQNGDKFPVFINLDSVTTKIYVDEKYKQPEIEALRVRLGRPDIEGTRIFQKRTQTLSFDISKNL